MLRSKLVLCTILLLLFAASTLTAFAARGDVKVTLTPVKDSLTADDGLLVNVAITNPNKSAVKLLRWDTPIYGVEDDLFYLVVNGKPVEYIGRHYKRPAPTDKDYLVLRGGETIETTVDLAGYYDLSATGFYEISYYVEGSDIFENGMGMGGEETLASKGIQVWVTGRETKVNEIGIPDTLAGSTGFTSCSTSRQNDLNNARSNASGYAANSFSYLNAGLTGPRYTTWFGTYSSTNYSKVRSNFSNISSAMDNASVTFNCSCTSSAYAYVYSNQPYTIYLCNAFWNAPATGTDSKAGTLVHEMSHFTVVAGTADLAYGQTAAKRLARQAKKAINNADSHEYFAENTPAQN